LSKRFGTGQRMVALDGIDLDVRQGEFLCLIGPSGCGKSTLLYMLAGLVAPNAGTLLMDGEPIAGPRRERGLVFQEDALFPWKSVAENIGFGLRVRAAAGKPEEEIRATVSRLVRLVGLQGFEEARPGELSGGMKQRAAIAACLATEPRVLLMDEPFGALDPITRHRLQVELRRLHQSVAKTIVFVTHDVDEAIKMADRIAILNVGGVLEQFAPPDEILRAPAGDFVARFVGSGRALKRLSLIPVASIELEPFAGGPDQVPTVGVDATLLEALDAIVASPGRSVRVLAADKTERGVLTLERIAREIAQ
jgi:osmoprotectant transport system ATP-binding protein